MKPHALRRRLACAALCLLALFVPGCSGGFSFGGILHSLNPFAADDAPTSERLGRDPTGLIGTFGHIATGLIGLGAIALLIGCLIRDLKVVSGACIAIGLGVAFASLRGVIAEHPVVLYAALGVSIAAVVYLNYHGGAKAIQHLKKGKPNVDEHRPLRDPGPARVVPAAPSGAQQSPAVSLPAREWTDGGGAAS